MLFVMVLIMKKPKKEAITNDFLQNYVGGRFSSVQKYGVGRPTVFTGVVKKISLKSGVITFYRVIDDQKIEVSSSYAVCRYYNDNRIMFESADQLHTVILYRPK